MSTVDKFRYLLAAASALLGVGLIAYGDVFVGILCLISAVLLLPILYRLLLIQSGEVQFLSPLLFLAITFFSYMMLDLASFPVDAPLKTEYIPATQTTTASQYNETTTTAFENTIDAATTTIPVDESHSSESVGNAVYRTPSGTRYHLSLSCGGKNAYEVTLDEAVESGLTPCKKCAGG